MVELFGILSGLFLLCAGFFILLQIKSGKSIPNLTTWLIGMMVGLINSISFYKIVDDNFYQAFIFFVSLFTTVIIFFYSITKSKFARLKMLDISLLSLAIFVSILWRLTDDRLANFLVQIVIFIANLATIVGLWRGYLKEFYLPWIFVIFAYVISIVGLTFTYDGDWLPFFGPILNGIISNGFILLLSLKFKNYGKSCFN